MVTSEPCDRKRNTEHVDRLIAEGRMQEYGLVHVHAAKADGRWEKACCLAITVHKQTPLIPYKTRVC